METKIKTISAQVLYFALLTSMSTVALAHDNVTLYGVLDEGIDYTNNAGGHDAFKMQGSDLTGTRWGIKGQEDLGGGTAALFQLENGFSLENGAIGQGGRMFGRQAFAGLTNRHYGTVTLGRQYDSLVDDLAPLTANGDWGGGPFSHPLDNDNTSNSFRLDNAVKYTSKSYRGFSVTGLYAFGNQTRGTPDNHAFSAAVQYLSGPLSLAAAFVQLDRPSSNDYGAVARDSGNFSARRQRIWGGGANYVLGATTLGLVYTHTALSAATASTFVGPFPDGPATLAFDNIEANARYQFSPALSLGAMYTYTTARYDAAKGEARPKWHQAAAIVDYALSKRTDVYAQLSYQRMIQGESDTALDTADVSGSAAASSTPEQVFARVGLRHLF